MTRKRKETRDTPTRRVASIVNGDLYYEDVRQCSINDRESFEDCIAHDFAIRVVSLDSTWFQHEWLGDELVAADIDMEMTLRLELRKHSEFWYAYRRVGGKLFKRYVGAADQLTARRLVEVARKLPTRKMSFRRD